MPFESLRDLPADPRKFNREDSLSSFIRFDEIAPQYVHNTSGLHEVSLSEETDRPETGAPSDTLNPSALANDTSAATDDDAEEKYEIDYRGCAGDAAKSAGLLVLLVAAAASEVVDGPIGTILAIGAGGAAGFYARRAHQKCFGSDPT